MQCTPFEPVARFHGTLDITALGGAGFASQRATRDEAWDLRGHDGVEVVVVAADGTFVLASLHAIRVGPVATAAAAAAKTNERVTAAKRYTLTLKDELLPPDPATGREQSTVSYEYDFVAHVGKMRHPRVRRIRVPWASFTATYRGKENKDAPPLDLERVRRLSLMMRR